MIPVTCSNGSGAVQPVEADLVVTGAGELLTCPAEGKGIGLVVGGAVAAKDGRVVWVGPSNQVKSRVALVPGAMIVDAGDRVVMPGLVECHTHLVFAGDRSAELQARVAGATYLEVARAGGGIASTVRATCAASDETLLAFALGRLTRFLSFGVTTIEAKTGYGLSLEQELRVLELYKQLGALQPADVIPTLMAAHRLPDEYEGRRQDFVDLVTAEMIPTAAERGLARFCDAFCEVGAFTVGECRAMLSAGAQNGLRPKLHADQLSEGGGAALAVEVGAVSADHLEFVSDSGIAALAGAGVTAVLLPGATFFLDSGRFAPARRLLDSGVHIALSTDFNPGTSPSENLWLMATMGCCSLHMTAAEVIRGITCEAARALDLGKEVGSLEVGKRADILILELKKHTEIPYHYGINPVLKVFKSGKYVSGAEPTHEVRPCA
jgi:imidazolonepropionase